MIHYCIKHASLWCGDDSQFPHLGLDSLIPTASDKECGQACLPTCLNFMSLQLSSSHHAAFGTIHSDWYIIGMEKALLTIVHCQVWLCVKEWAPVVPAPRDPTPSSELCEWLQSHMQITTHGYTHSYLEQNLKSISWLYYGLRAKCTWSFRVRHSSSWFTSLTHIFQTDVGQTLLILFASYGTSIVKNAF